MIRTELLLKAVMLLTLVSAINGSQVNKKTGVTDVRQIWSQNYPSHFGKVESSSAYTIWGWFRFDNQLDSQKILRLINRGIEQADDGSINEAQKTADEEILSMSYSRQDKNGQEVYDLTFQASGALKEANIKGIEFDNNTWNFIAVSVDYSKGNMKIFFLPCDNSTEKATERVYGLDQTDIQIGSNTDLILTGFEGNILSIHGDDFRDIKAIGSNLEYTDDFKPFWMGYTPQNSIDENGRILDLVFYDRNKIRNLSSKKNTRVFYLDSEDIETNNSSRDGALLGTNSSIDLYKFNFRNAHSPVRSYVFNFQLSFAEELPDELVLLERGVRDESGYMLIRLIKNGGGRVINIVAQGNDQEINWQSKSILKEGKKHTIVTGISVAPGGCTHVVYLDSEGEREIIRKADNFNFDSANQQIILFNNKSSDSYKGHINLNRFMVMNNGAAFVAKRAEKTDSCLLYSSLSRNSNSCLQCNDGFVSMNNSCKKCCDIGYENVRGLCLKCSQEGCKFRTGQDWRVDRREDDTFRLYPNVPLNTKLSKKKPFRITLKNRPTKPILYDYKYGDDNEYIEVELVNKRIIEDKTLIFTYIVEDQLCGSDGNMIANSSASYDVDKVCYVRKSKRRGLRSMAIIVLGLYALSLLLLILFSLCCFKKIYDLGGLWKFFLHNWMRLQMVAMFILLAVYMPCCIKEFLNVLYRIVVKWDHAFDEIIDDSKENNTDYNEGLIDQRPPLRFAEQGVAAFILHNIMVAFIAHLFIFLIYMAIKLWDWLITSDSRCMYRTFLLFEFTILIVGYLLVEMHIFVFSALNFRLAIFSTAYFVICFLIAIFYILVFVIFWFIALARIFGAEEFWNDKVNVNRYYYFFAGYRDNKWARSYDLWLVMGYLAIGMMIGLLIKSPLAQLIVIISVLVVLLALTIMLRPWESNLLWMVEIISQVCIIVAVAILLVMAVYDHDDCRDCGDREGVLCWLVVAFLFAGLVIAALGLIFGLFAALCSKTRKTTIVTEHNEVIEKESTERARVVNEMERDNYQSHVKRSDYITNANPETYTVTRTEVKDTAVYDSNNDQKIIREDKDTRRVTFGGERVMERDEFPQYRQTYDSKFMQYNSGNKWLSESYGKEHVINDTDSLPKRVQSTHFNESEIQYEREK